MFLRLVTRKLFSRLRNEQRMLVTAESLTGGMLGTSITALPGSSDVYWGGIVAYSNCAKQKLLGVNEALLASFGPVSAEVAESMAAGVLPYCENGVAVAVTGVAGPGGGTETVPVGSVWIAASVSNGDKPPLTVSRLYRFSGTRKRIRQETTRQAFGLALELLDS